MALRSLGSSLVAKSSPGAKLREKEEFTVTKPVIPGKGVPGSLQRQFVEEPGVRAIPPGSERIITPTPGAEVESQATPFTPPVNPEAAGILPGIIGQPGAGQPPAGIPSGAQNQALFQGENVPEFKPAAAAPQARVQRTPQAARATANLLGAFTGPKYQPEVPEFEGEEGQNVGFQAEPGRSSGQNQPSNPFLSNRSFIGGIAPAVKRAAPAVLRSLGTAARGAPDFVRGLPPQARIALPFALGAAALAQPNLRSKIGAVASNLRSKASNVISNVGKKISGFFRR